MKKKPTIVVIILILIVVVIYLVRRDSELSNDKISNTAATDCDLVGKDKKYQYGVDYEYINSSDIDRSTADCAPIRYLK